MRRIRVAHVITRLCKGGAQENTFHTVRLANRDRYEVDLISGPAEGPEGSLEDRVREAGITIEHVPSLVRQIQPMSDFRAWQELTRLFRARHYDIVHTHTSKAGFLGRLAAFRAKVPIVVHTPHGNIFQGYFSQPVTQCFIAAERYAARRTDRIIELTPSGIEEHLACGIGRREQYTTIFSGIDLSPYDRAIAQRAETRRALGFFPDDIVIGAVGRLEPVKGFSYFVSAAKMVADTVPQARFILAGQGALESELREAAAPLGTQFEILGFRHDVADLMAVMDVFVLSSLNEGMGRVLLEAGAAGTASVATRVGGVPDIVTPERTGLLVPARDAEALAEAILRLVHNRVLRETLGQNARAFVVPAFGLEQMVQQIEALYETLIREKRLDNQ